MSGGWQGSRRREQLPPDWKRIRVTVLERDGYRCTESTEDGRCIERATDVDHLEDPQDHSLSNLGSKCGPHHDKKSARQGGLAGARLHRPKEPHPGVL